MEDDDADDADDVAYFGDNSKDSGCVKVTVVDFDDVKVNALQYLPPHESKSVIEAT